MTFFYFRFWNDKYHHRKNDMESNIDNGRIGCNSISSNGNANFFTGNLMEIGLWNTALPIGTDETTEGSVKWLYNTGTGRKANTISAGLKVYYPLSGSVVTNAAVVVDKSKDSITNVPVGTRYEETDTRKIFRFAVGAVWVSTTGTLSRAEYLPAGSGDKTDGWSTTGNGGAGANGVATTNGVNGGAGGAAHVG